MHSRYRPGALVGSPPRVRGHVLDRSSKLLQRGITPAGAGTCWPKLVIRLCRKDHPRGCGDMAQHLHELRRGIGSPPRVRGHVFPVLHLIDAIRITPAGAGTCYRDYLLENFPEDHPRGCGDMSCPAIRMSPTTGSPPRVRGHGPCLDCQTLLQRITPAGAGTCRIFSVQTAAVEDHPRGCGDMNLEKSKVST